MNTAEKNNLEKKKYHWLNENTDYGSSHHGEPYVKLISSLGFETLLDMGTGDGRFCYEISDYYRKVYGLDWEIEPSDQYKNLGLWLKGGELGVEYLKSDATSIPLGDNSVDITTSFDFMEHLIPEVVDSVIEEMVRVTKHLLVNKVETRSSNFMREELTELFGDGELHPTVKGVAWWFYQFSKYGQSWILEEQNTWATIITVL